MYASICRLESKKISFAELSHKIYNNPDATMTVEAYTPVSMQQRLQRPTLKPPQQSTKAIEPVVETYHTPEHTEPKSESAADADAGGLCNAEGTCSIDYNKPNSKLMPVMDPRFNAREAVKQMILLQDHLFTAGKRCPDCIMKHCLFIEGLLEEALTLDKTQEYTDIFSNVLQQFVGLYNRLSQGITNKTLTDPECHLIAQEIRQLRKPLMMQFAGLNV